MILVVGGVCFALCMAFPKSTPADDAASKGNTTKTEAAKDTTTKAADTKDAKDAKDTKDAKSGDKAAPKTAAKEEEEIEPADNSYCIVCHLNYEAEKLTRKHQIAGVGCAKCHGDSEKHSGDEDGLTAPDVIFAHEDVDKFCMTCHPKEKIIKNENHKDVFDPKIAKDEHLVCTECHAENHKMAVRTRKWDKKTRKLLSDDGIRMMYKDSPATNGVPEASKKDKK
jgi:hypothetical protein